MSEVGGLSTFQDKNESQYFQIIPLTNPLPKHQTMAGLMNTIQAKLGELTTGAASKKALLLGAGFVCKPTAQILADAGVEVTIGAKFKQYSSLLTKYLLTFNSLQNSQICPEAIRRPQEHPPDFSRCHGRVCP